MGLGICQEEADRGSTVGAGTHVAVGAGVMVGWGVAVGIGVEVGLGATSWQAARLASNNRHVKDNFSLDTFT